MNVNSAGVDLDPVASSVGALSSCRDSLQPPASPWLTLGDVISGALLLLLATAHADVASTTPVPIDSGGVCEGVDDGEACATEEGVEGVCEAEACVEEEDEEGKGCATSGVQLMAWSGVAGALGLLAVGRRRL